jgi:hypothetical protein
MSCEEWRPVVGFEGTYDVSNIGRVRRVAGSHQCPAGRILGQAEGNRGHLSVSLSLEGHRHTRWVHRLVLAAFVGPCPQGMEVRHLDGDPKNNAVQNLAYGTRSENELDKVRHGTHNNAKKTHCPHGHEYTPENTSLTSSGRSCKTCAARRARKRIQERRAAGWCAMCTASRHPHCRGNCPCPRCLVTGEAS